MFLQFAFLARSIDLSNAVELVIPESYIEGEWYIVNATDLDSKLYIIKHPTAQVKILGNQTKATGFYVQGNGLLVFQANSRTNFVFDYLMTNKSISFIGEITIEVREEYRSNCNTIRTFSENLFSKNVPKILGIVSLDVSVRIVIAPGVTIVWENDDNHLILDKKFLFTKILLIVSNQDLRITCDDSRNKSFIPPDVVFVGNNDSSLLIFNDWKGINKYFLQNHKMTITSSGKLTIYCELSELPFPDQYELISPDYKVVTNCFNGTYYLIDEYSQIPPEIQFPIKTSRIRQLKRLFEPTNNTITLYIVGSHDQSRGIILPEMNYSDINIKIIAYQSEPYVEVSNSQMKSLYIEELNCKASETKISDFIQISSSPKSNLAMISTHDIQIKSIETFGFFQLNCPHLICDKILTNIESFRGISNLLTQNSQCSIELVLEKPQNNLLDNIQWNSKDLTLQLDNLVDKILYNQFSSINIVLKDILEDYQVKLDYLAPNTISLQNIFNISIESAKTPIFLFNFNFNNFNPHLNIKSSSENKYKVKTYNDSSLPNRVKLFDSYEKVENSNGMYCVINSGSNFTQCSIYDDRIIYKNIAITERFENNTEIENKIKLYTNCEFSSTSIQNLNISFIGNGESLVIDSIFENNSFTFSGLHVKFNSQASIKAKSLIFDKNTVVEWGNPSIISISRKLKIQTIYFKEIASKLDKADSLSIDLLFDGNETNVIINLDGISLFYDSKPIEISFEQYSHLTFYIFKLFDKISSEFRIDIYPIQKSLISQVFDIVSENSKTFISFPSYTGDEDYVIGLQRGVFSGGIYHISSEHCLIPHELFDFGPNAELEINNHGSFCIYREDMSQCPENHYNIQLKDNDEVNSSLIGRHKYYDIHIIGFNSNNSLKFSYEVMDNSTFFITGVGETNQNVVLPSNYLNSVKLTRISASFRDKTADIESLSLISSSINCDSIKIRKIYCDYQIFTEISNILPAQTYIELNADNINNIHFSSSEITLNFVKISYEKFPDVKLIFFKKIIESLPLVLHYNGNSNDQISFIPKFQFNYLDNIYIRFSSTWENKSVSSPQKIDIKAQTGYSVFISSDYNSFPEEVFEFNRFIFSGSTVARYHLIPENSKISCKSNYICLKYSKYMMNPNSFNETKVAQKTIIVIDGSDPDIYPIISENVFKTKSIIEIVSDTTKQILKTNFSMILSLKIKNCVLLTTKNLLSSSLYLIDGAMINTTTKTIESYHLYLKNSDDQIISYFSQNFYDRFITVTCDSCTDIIYNQNEAIIKENNKILYKIPQNLFSRGNLQIINASDTLTLGYNGITSCQLSFAFIIDLIFAKNPTKVIFDYSWRSSVVVCSAQGIFDCFRGELKYFSEYESYPSDVFHIPAGTVINYPNRGKYCIINEKSELSSICPKNYKIIETKYAEKVIDEVRYDENNNLDVYVLTSFSLNSKQLGKISIFSGKSEISRSTVNIIGQTNLQNSEISLFTTDLSFNENLIFRKIQLNNSEVKSVGNMSNKIFTNTIIGDLNSLSISQSSIICKTLATVFCGPKEIYIENDKYKIDNSVIIYDKLLINLSYDSELTIKSSKASIKFTPSIVANGNALIIFDSSIYFADSQNPGEISHQNNGTLYLRSSTNRKPDLMFFLPPESLDIVYQFGYKPPEPPKRTPTQTFNYSIAPYITNNKKKEVLLFFVILISISISFLSIFVIYKWRLFVLLDNIDDGMRILSIESTVLFEIKSIYIF